MRALEIGFNSGSSALAFLAAQPEARLISIDCFDWPNAMAMIKNHGFDNRLEFIKADSREFLKVKPEWRGGFNYIYIDGDHLYDAVKQDLFNCSWLLAPGGAMVVDDCVPGHELFGVHQAVQEFLAAHPEFTCEPLPGNPNQAVILTIQS